MLNVNSLIALVALLSVIVTNSSAQEYYHCDGNQFGYPRTAQYGGAGHGGAIAANHHARQEKLEAWKSESAKIYARNDAWPKPFACGDKMLYFSVWDVMINQGYANHCILGEDHFQSENNHLNQAGQMKIASIMQNLPADRRQLWIVRDHNSGISQARLDSVNQVVQTFYSQSAPNTLIALTDRQPAMISGLQADAISKRQIEGTPLPIIPVVSGGQSVQASSGQ